MTRKKEENRIVLGSGKLYITELPNHLDTSLTSVASTFSFFAGMANEDNLLGLISGGAELEYTSNMLTVSDDKEIATKTVVTTEGVTLKGGIITWNGKVMEKLVATCRVTDDPILGYRQMKIGGLENDNGKVYALLFVHDDKADGDLYVFITGKNTAGIKMAFKKDAATTVDPTFTAEALDDTGTKLVILEQIPQSGLLTITSEAGTNNGTTKLTFSGNAPGTGESYAYKAAASGTLSIPAYLEAITVGSGNYTTWNGSADISTTNGYDILLVVKNADNKVVKAGIVTAVCKTA